MLISSTAVAAKEDDMKALPDGFQITVRPDRISPWFDVSFKDDHWASFKTVEEAITYINNANAEYDGSEDSYELGPCGCIDYHMADCPTRQPRRL